MLNLQLRSHHRYESTAVADVQCSNRSPSQGDADPVELHGNSAAALAAYASPDEAIAFCSSDAAHRVRTRSVRGPAHERSHRRDLNPNIARTEVSTC